MVKVPMYFTCSSDNPKLAGRHEPLSCACVRKSQPTRFIDKLATSCTSNFLDIAFLLALRSLFLASKASCVSKLINPCFLITLLFLIWEKYSFKEMLSMHASLHVQTNCESQGDLHHGKIMLQISLE